MQVREAPKAFMKLRKRLLKSVYGADPCYRDSTTPLLRMVLSPTGRTAAASEQLPVIVAGNDGSPLVAAVFIVAGNLPNVLQVAFFEAVADRQGAVDLLVSRALAFAVDRDLDRVVVGLQGHVNNGLGFLAGPYGSPASFGSPYNPPYYIDYMARCASSQETLVSYLYDLSVRNLDREKKVIQRAARRFRVRQADFGELRREIGIYTKLNNECFKDHPFYFERAPEEDYELFRSFGPFLKEENFLVSELDGRPVGFLLWYPDFNELVRPRGKLGPGTALKYRLPVNRISRFRIAEFGVLPEYQGSAAIAGLIGRCVEIARRNGHTLCESGWILDGNRRSRAVSTRWAERPYKTYKVFEIEVTGRERGP